MSRIPAHVRARKATLADVAKETLEALPGILQQLPHLKPLESQVHSPDDLPALDVSSTSPRFELVSSPPSRSKTYGTRLKVLNMDTFDAAIMMADSLGTQQQPRASTAAGAVPPAPSTNQRVAVLNLASESKPGGGWLTGAVAQEEALCYRSSLALSLYKQYYPLAPLSAIYTRDVVIVRSSMDSGHQLLLSSSPSFSSSSPRTTTAGSLPVVSVISVAAIRRPGLRKVMTSALSSAGSGSGSRSSAPGDLSRNREERTVFKNAADRDLTKAKMRLVLRAAARAGHELLVLGALGCGVFRNPPGDVARCWLEVLNEAEFAGGRWFREIWFAVLDKKNEGNFDVFQRVLGGREVGKVVVQG